MYLPKLSQWYSADFGKDMKTKIAKLLLMSKQGGRSSTVLTQLLAMYGNNDATADSAGQSLYSNVTYCNVLYCQFYFLSILLTITLLI